MSKERVLCVPQSEVQKVLGDKVVSDSLPDINQLLSIRTRYIERDSVEEDPNYRQLIPYVILNRDSKLFVYPRGGTEAKTS